MAKMNKFDRQHIRNLSAYERRIDEIYKEAAKEAAAIGMSIYDFNPDRPFSFADYPATRRRVEKLLSEMKENVTVAIVNGVRSEWTLANNKNNELARQVFGRNVGKLTQEQYRRYFSTNGKALEAFLSRKAGGLKLSDRVWKYTGMFKEEIELGLDIGIRNGLSADEMSHELRDYLRHPDKLFRRIRDEHGVLQLSKRAAAFHPGQGVYRSSYKNARRLAATETNIAYRTSDYERWQDFDFVVGIEIKLSNNHTLNGHPFHDICDELKGRYPKDFKFTGWHPHCRCHAVTILKTEEEFMEDNQRILEGKEPVENSQNEITGVPDNYRKWISDNADRVKQAEQRGTLPYFIRDNKQYAPHSIPSDAIPIKAAAAKFNEAKYHSIDQIEKNIDINKLKQRSNEQKDGSTYQGYLGEIQGFNDLPQNIFAEEFNKLSADDKNYIDIFRGYRDNGDLNVENFKHGKLYEGLGAYGNGSYFGIRESTALSYTTDNNKNHIVYALIDKKATKIANYDDLKDTWMAERGDKLERFSKAAKEHFNVEKLSQIPADKLDDFETIRQAIYGDFGGWCTAKGYDCIYIPSEEFYVILNRTKLIVK